MRRSLHAVLALAVVLAAAPRALTAQTADREGFRLSPFDAGLDIAVAQPVGDFAYEVGGAGGLSIHGAYHLTPAFALGVEGTYLIYGHERRQVCGPGSCRVMLDLDTNNQIVSAFFGPQLEAPTGPVRPYARGGIGLGYFFTSSSLSGTWDAGSFASTTNYHDAVFALTGGAGLRVPFAIQRVPVALDLGGRYQRNGNVSYLRKGTGITDNPDGSVVLHPTTGPADFIVWHLGVTVTIPHPGEGRR